MKETTLLIMAAGMGSRFGEEIKQLEPMGLHDELIIDYSIHDAIKADFSRIIIVLRKEIEADFHERIGRRREAVCRKQGVELVYAFQDLHDVPGVVPEGRTKPWGTSQAVLAAGVLIKGPFAVINADDYYGREAYAMMHDWLIQEHGKTDISMIGYVLGNTLSDSGSVNRGICRVDGNRVTEVVETVNIIKTVSADGTLGAEAGGEAIELDSIVSMNFWGFAANEGCTPRYLELLEEEFGVFFNTKVRENPLKAEYPIPVHVGKMLGEGKCSLTVLRTHDQWFGVTYKEDKDAVVENFRRLIADGVYAEELYSDL